MAGLAHGVAEDLLPLHVDLSLVGPTVLVPQVRLKQTKINQSINQARSAANDFGGLGIGPAVQCAANPVARWPERGSTMNHPRS